MYSIQCAFANLLRYCHTKTHLRGGLTQWVACLTHSVEVVGSTSRLFPWARNFIFTA